MKEVISLIGIISLFPLVGTAAALTESKNINAAESVEIALPDFSAGKQVILQLKCQQPRPKYSGYLHMMRLMVNAQTITPRRYGKIPVLLNKEPEFAYMNKKVPFFKDGKWLVFYNKDYGKLPSFVKLSPDQAYCYTFDISSFLKSSGNKLKIVNTWNKAAAQRYKSSMPLEFSLTVKEQSALRNKDAIFQKICGETILRAETSKDWTLMVPEKLDKDVYLLLETWQPYKKFGGFNYPLKLKINGLPVDADLDRLNPVLTNKSNKFVYNGKTYYYNSGAGIWLSMYSPGPDYALGRHGIKEPEPYAYLLNITSFLKPGKNILTVENVWTKMSQKQYKRELPLTVRADLAFLPADKNRLSSLQPKPELTGALTLKPQPGGAFAITAGNTSIPVYSQFSKDGGGWNCLTGSAPDNISTDWKVITDGSGRKLEIVAECNDYRLQRTVQLIDRRVKIEDHLINKTAKDIAIRQHNQINFSGFNLPVCRMGGLPSHSTNNFTCATNSTMFLPAQKSSLGWVMEDDVLRNHGKMFYRAKEKSFGVADDFFVLGAGKSYTVKWSLYVLRSDDYFDFINRVRQDWGANFTIPGPFYFVNMSQVLASSPEQLNELISINRAKYISFWELRANNVPEADNRAVLAYGNALWIPQMEKTRHEAQTAIAKLHALNSGVKATVYIHCFFNGFEAPGDQSFKDSWITGFSGKRAQSVYSSKINYPYRTVYPGRNNTFGKLFHRSLDFYLNTLKVDWLYWDESNGPGATAKNNKGASNVTFNDWDGYSAVIDPKTNRIDKKFASLPLISRDVFKFAIKKIYAKPGGLILFNGPATTACRLKTLSMAESQDHIVRCYSTHLNTPLAYGFGTPKFSAIVERLNYGCLYVRTHLNYNCDAVTKFYPFTPLEIHKGWVKGKERIITNKSGKFGWPGKFKARIWDYDKNGKKLESNPATTNYRDKASITVSEGGLSILEKIE